MDCRKGMANMDAESVDLVVTSPPYDSLRDYKGYIFDEKRTIDLLYRVVKKGGVVVWIVNDATIDGSETGSSFRQALYFKEVGFNIHDTMIWKKVSGNQHKVRYIPSFEYMFVFSKGSPKTVNLIMDRENRYAGQLVQGYDTSKNGEKRIKSGAKKSKVIKEVGVRLNVWEIPADTGSRTCHPAVFPEILVRDHILSWSNKGDLVLDPFMGSGTTAVAALNTQRDFIGFEISEEYCKIAEDRLRNYLPLLYFRGDIRND